MDAKRPPQILQDVTKEKQEFEKCRQGIALLTIRVYNISTVDTIFVII